MKVNLITLYATTMGSGKTEVAKHLVKNHGFTLVKFAEPMKAMTDGLLRSIGYTRGQRNRMLEGDLKEMKLPELSGASPRLILQTLGTEWRDQIDTDLWVNIAMDRADRLIAEGQRVVIDDMRFPHEFDAVMARDRSLVVKVVRPDAKAYANHPSEGLLDGYNFDVELMNDEDVAMLQQATDWLMASLEGDIE